MSETQTFSSFIVSNPRKISHMNHPIRLPILYFKEKILSQGDQLIGPKDLLRL